jgi:hypothetical protein
MCLACDMESLWFAVMDTRANAAAEAAPQSDEPLLSPAEPVTLLAPMTPDGSATPVPPPERGRVGEGVAGEVHETAGSAQRESEGPHPNRPPEERGGGAPSKRPPRRFACEETSAE